MHYLQLPVLSIIGLLVFLGLASFIFSAAEASLLGFNKLRLRHMIAKGIKRAQSIQRLVKNLDKVIAAILIGNNIVNIAISAIVTAIFIQIFGYRWGVVLATFSTTLAILIFCEVTPKILATKHTERTALLISPIMEALVSLLRPLLTFFTGISNFILKIFGLDYVKRSPLITEEELRTMIEIGREEGVLSDDKRKMLSRIFEFGETKVNQVMVPKDKIVSVSKKATPEELLNIFVEKGHSRIPVHQDSVDNIIGIIYARDLLYIIRDKGLFLLEDLIHSAYYVSTTTKVNDLLKKFQSDKIQIAIVVDDNKKTLGLVTLEDLTEEIVGEIEEVHVKHSSRKI
jgi:CBS domain containing-hemolysin-like protein